MKEYPTFPKTPRLELLHQMLFDVILKTQSKLFVIMSDRTSSKKINSKNGPISLLRTGMFLPISSDMVGYDTSSVFLSGALLI